ncbi:MAG: DUF3883 domain-containing protein [Gemmatimonadetes bacterium]|nr:DUF3883 domain-containing protein [Gemmatimonadota bacterium]
MRGSAGDWLTASRVRRLPQVLGAVRAQPPPGMPRSGAVRAVWRICDGPLDEVPRLIETLIDTALLASRGGYLRLTQRGRRVATQDHQHGGRYLGQALIEAGLFREQIGALISAATFDAHGNLLCRRGLALETAAQLVGILRRWNEVVWLRNFEVPCGLVEDLLVSWPLMPTPRTSTDQKKEVGNRGEAYSFQFERERASDPKAIKWVALDDDSLGYDIEDQGANPTRLIEVKGSRLAEARFIMTASEWRVAQDVGDRYEVHYWGEITLSRSRVEEYQHLRTAGYPCVYPSLQEAISDGVLEVTPEKYRLTIPGGGGCLE